MKIFNPILVGPTAHKETANAPSAPSVPHEHVNLNVLNRITVDAHGVLLFDGKPVDTVGQEFVNAAILEQFTVVDNKLYFAGSPVDTTGSVFENEALLRKLSAPHGELLYEGSPVFRSAYEQIGINVVDPVTEAANITILSAVTAKLPKDFAGSVGVCDKPPSSALSLPVKIAGSQVGTINIATSGAVSFSGTEASDIQVQSGTKIQIVLDAMVGSGAGDLSVTLRLGV